jgi:hypothetical protein
MSRRKVIQRKTPHETPRLLQPRPITKPYSPESYSSFFLKDIADEITAFARSTDVDALSPVAITNVTPIASYSWIEASSATLRTIAVPGMQTDYINITC